MIGGRVRGVDVSHHQPAEQCDWQRAAAAGVRWAGVKLSEGREDAKPYVDPDAAAHMAKVREAGLIVQPYHFARVDRRKMEFSDGARAGASEAEWAALSVRRQGVMRDSMPLACDLERYRNPSDPSDAAPSKHWNDDFLRNFVKVYAEANGHLPDVYMGPKIFARRHNPELAIELCELGVQLWLARPEDDGDGVVEDDELEPSALITGWPWSIWQRSHTAEVPGLPGRVDLNIFRGTLAELRARVL